MKVPLAIGILFFLIPKHSIQAQEGMSAMQNFVSGRALENQNRLGDSLPYYAEAVRISLDEINRNVADPDTFTALTWALNRQRRYAEVIYWGEEGLRRFPGEFRVIQTMGEAYFYLNELDRSLQFMQRYTNLVPQGGRVSVAYFFMGEIYRYRRLFHHADMAYTTAVHLEPANALWWFRLGSVREAMGEYSQAAEAYEQALGLSPQYNEAANGLLRSRNQLTL
ncbi:MAG: tetratricopeptide repeat protein [Treponema sp.]|nr:tetratricopeptide repeat protein [Treponema sp.]